MFQDLVQEHVLIPVAGSDSPLDAYLARPAAVGTYPVVLVGMELFALTDHIQRVTDQVARLGFVALAPNFYHRAEPHANLPYSDEGRTRGLALLHQLSRADVLADIQAALAFLHARPEVHGRTGFVGFSVGGHIAYLAATQFNIAATACFYGGWLTTTDIPLSQPEPTVQLTPGIAAHGGRLLYFAGAQDPHATAAQREQLAAALQAAHVRHELVVYAAATHGFFCEARPTTFHEESRNDAWQRTARLLTEELCEQPLP